MAIVGTGLQVQLFTALYTSQIPDTNLRVSSTTAQGRTETVIDINSGYGIDTRDFETSFSWQIQQGTILYVWQPSFIPYPENSVDRASNWIDLGAAKFIQGYSIRADSQGVGKTFALESGDDQSIHPLIEIPAGGVVFNNQKRIVFSCVPFVAHSLRRVTTDGVSWRVWEEEPIFEPYPELQMNWTTELTSLGGTGWNHLRMMNLAYLSTQPVTLTFTVDTGNGSIAPIAIVLPSSGGTQTKVKLTPTYNKWKLIGFSATSPQGFRLWLPDIEVWVRAWGSSGEYNKLKPFGGQSSPAAQV